MPRNSLKKLLIISPAIPVFDHTHGDRRTYLIANILARQFKVYFLSQNIVWDEKYHKILKKNGIRLIFPGYKGIYNFVDIIKTIKFDIVMFEFFKTAAKYIDAVRKNSDAKVIIDTHLLNYLEAERIEKIFFNNKLKLGMKKNELKVYSKADTVIAITPKEKNILKRNIKNRIEFLYTGIEVPSAIRSREKRKNIVLSGYMMNTQNIDSVQYFVKKIFPYIKKELRDIKLYIVGSQPPERIIALNRSDIKVTGFIKDISLYLSMGVVSVVPLRVGAGMRYRIIESIAYGCPVVSTSLGAEGLKLKDSEEILIADTPESISSKLIEIYNDRLLWEKLSRNGYEKIKKEFSYKKMEKKLLEIVKI